MDGERWLMRTWRAEATELPEPNIRRPDERAAAMEFSKPRGHSKHHERAEIVVLELLSQRAALSALRVPAHPFQVF
jgi:hypothetical protein